MSKFLQSTCETANPGNGYETWEQWVIWVNNESRYVTSAYREEVADTVDYLEHTNRLLATIWGVHFAMAMRETPQFTFHVMALLSDDKRKDLLAAVYKVEA